MTGLADTSLFIARETGRRLASKVPDDLAVSIVTVGELRLGVLTATTLDARERHLSTLQLAISLEPIPIDDPVAEAWAGMVARLRTAGLRMPVNDSWIAATALAHRMPLVTQDRDYETVEGLEVIRV